MDGLREAYPDSHTQGRISQIADFPPSEEGKRVSEAEYWENYYEYPDIQYEWNDGYLEVKPVSDYETWLAYHWMTELLGYYLRTNPVAKMVGLEFGFRMALPHKTVIRKADLGVVLNTNPVPLSGEDHSYRGIFDLCIEAVSDLRKKDIERDTVQKKAEYEAGGVREYYILDGKGRETAFYTRSIGGIYQHIIPIKADVIASESLPGFQFRISDLHRRPSPEEMAEDEVYQGFVLLSYQAEKHRTEQLEKQLLQEQQISEQERMKAEQERQRADRLAEKLRKLEISSE